MKKDKTYEWLQRLTNGETLFLRRRRQGESQSQAAKRFNISRVSYNRWEVDAVPSMSKRERIMKLEPHELCSLYRRRNQLSQEEVADMSGLTRWLVNQKEVGRVNADDLLACWNSYYESMLEDQAA